MEKKGFNKVLIDSINPKKFDLSTIILIISNIIVIVLALIQKWNLIYLLWVYLGQNFIIGFFVFIRMLSIKKPEQLQIKKTNFYGKTEYKKANKYFYAFFFLFHYGSFNIVYLVILGVISSLAASEFDIFPGYWGLALLIFFINHLFSFIYNFKREANSRKNIETIMFLPYLRIFPMHLLPFVVGMFFGNFLITFFVLKTIVDVIAHNIDHNYSA